MGKVTFYFGIHDGTEENKTPRNQTEEVYEIDCEYYFATKVLRCMTMVFKDGLVGHRKEQFETWAESIENHSKRKNRQ